MTAAAASSTSAWTLESPRLRRDLLVALIVLAVVSPNITVVDSLPAIRAEQLLMAAMLPSLVWLHWRRPEFRRVTALDVVFACLAVAIMLSIAFAPVLVSSVDWSIRDPFEVARVVEYWLMYRFGLTLIPEAETSLTIAWTLLVATVGTTIFSLIQYLDGLGSFNEHVTDIWAVSHNLVGVQREGRVIGTIGNANYYSFFVAIPLIIGLAFIMLKRIERGTPTSWVILAGTFCAVFSAIMAQSRTGAVAILFGLFCGLVLVLVLRRPAAPFKAIGYFLACVIVSVVFMQVQKPLVHSFNARFNPAHVDEDASFIIRIKRLQTFFTGFFDEAPSFCEGDRLETRIIPDAKKARSGATTSTAADDVKARDATRKDDINDLTAGVIDYYCEEDKWPVGDSLESLLVPDHMDAMPKDPATGEDYLAYVSPAGFSVGAQLEDPADPQGPIYSLGTIPNIIVASSFENSLGANWGPRGGAMVASVDNEGLFGSDAARVQIGPGGDVRQFVVFDFPLGEEFSASIWARSATGADEHLRLYIIGQQLDGTEVDPIEPTPRGTNVFTVPGSGEWVPLALNFTTPEQGRVTTMQFMLRSADAESSVDVFVDGATLTQGDFPQSYMLLSDVDPATLRPVDLPQFADSPLIGVGPRNNAEAGAFDNEYVLFLDRYGLLGTLTYLAMYVLAAWVAISSFRRGGGLRDVIGLSMFAYTMTLLLFNVGAGSYYHFAIMAIYWLLIGYCGARGAPARTASAAEPSAVRSGAPQSAATAAAPGASQARVTRG